jgi:hypothetical protein
MAKKKKLSDKQLEGRRRYYAQAWHHKSPASELKQAKHAPGGQRMVQSCMLASLVCTMVWYAVAAIVHGSASVFLVAGFLSVDGLPAIAYGLGLMVLASGWALHVHERHWPSYKAAQYQELRRAANWSAACLLGLALLGLLMGPGLMPQLQRMMIDPQASWPLWPTVLSWRVFLFFSQTKLFHVIMMVGIASMVLALLCFKVGWIRLGFMGNGLISLSFAAYFLGDASYQYAVTRGLGQLQDAELMAHYLQQPAQANAWISVCQSIGWGALAMGIVLSCGIWTYSKSELAQAAARADAA